MLKRGKLENRASLHLQESSKQEKELKEKQRPVDKMDSRLSAALDFCSLVSVSVCVIFVCVFKANCQVLYMYQVSGFY